MPKKIIIHIGTLKTGSTSLQTVLSRKRGLLLDQGVEFYRGKLEAPNFEQNHRELGVACLRDDCESLFRPRRAIVDHEAFYETTQSEIHDFAEKTTAGKLIFSCEDLSFLRSKNECRKLRSLFPEEAVCKIVVVLRDKNTFLESYTKQIYKIHGRRPSVDPKSALYVGKDTWLTDYETLLKSYRSVFENVSVITYEQDDLINKILSQLELDLRVNESEYRENISTKTVAGQRLKQISLEVAYNTVTFLGMKDILKKLIAKLS